MIERRSFITLLGGAALAWPMVARGQQQMPVVGMLYGGAEEPIAGASDAAFRKGLDEQGYVEGRNVVIEYRSTEQNDRFPALAAELVGHQVSLIFASSLTAAAAAKAATTTIPIVFSGSGDPVRVGLVASLGRPGGNVTGLTSLGVELVPKRLELLRELVPQATVIGVLTNPTRVTYTGGATDLEMAARSIGQEILQLNAATGDEIDEAFATAAKQRIGALLVDVGALFRNRRNQIIALATRYALPANYSSREFVEGGGLISYGQDALRLSRQAGIYVGRILKGEKPADLPVMQPTTFELVLNLKTAKALGLTIPPGLLAIADEVIE